MLSVSSNFSISFFVDHVLENVQGWDFFSHLIVVDNLLKNRLSL